MKKGQARRDSINEGAGQICSAPFFASRPERGERMKEDCTTTLEQTRDDTFERIEFLLTRNPRAWQSAGAAAGLACGVLAPAFGTLMAVVGWLVNQQTAGFSLNRLSTILFVMTI